MHAYETKLNSPQLMRCYGMVTLCEIKLLHACIWLKFYREISRMAAICFELQ